MDDIVVATYICYVQSIVIICFMDIVLVDRVVSGVKYGDISHRRLYC